MAALQGKDYPQREFKSILAKWLANGLRPGDEIEPRTGEQIQARLEPLAPSTSSPFLHSERKYENGPLG